MLFDFIEIGIGGFFGGFFGGCFLFNVFVFVDVDNFVKLFFELDLEDWFFVINFIDFINLVSLFWIIFGDIFWDGEGRVLLLEKDYILVGVLVVKDLVLGGFFLFSLVLIFIFLFLLVIWMGDFGLFFGVDLGSVCILIFISS